MDFCGITGNNKVKFFIASIGSETFAILRRLACPKRPKELTFDECIKLLEEYFDPKPLQDVCRYKFRKRKQLENEKFATFHAALNELSVNCNFGDRMEEEIRSQIIFGVYDGRVQKQLFNTPNLTFKKAVEIITNFELANKSYNEVHVGENSSSSYTAAPNVKTEPNVNKVNERVKKNYFPASKKRRPPSKVPVAPSAKPDQNSVDVCYRCARKNHRAPECRFINSTCNSCKEVGHLATVCGKNHDEIRAVAFRKKNSSVKVVNTKHSLESVVDIGKVSAVSVSSAKNNDSELPPDKIFIVLAVNDKSVKFEADCGSDFTFMSLAECTKLGLKNKIQRAHRVFESYDHSSIELFGIVPVKVRYKSRVLNLRLRIVDGDYSTLLGRDWLLPFNIDVREHVNSTAKIYQTKLNDQNELLRKIEALHERFADLFVEEIGCIPNSEVDIHLQPDAVPVFCRARQVPFALQKAVNDEIDRLVANGIYTPTTSSKWATPIVPVKKSNGAIRLVGDYSITVNRHIVPKNYPIPNIEEVLVGFSGCCYFTKYDIRDAYMHKKFSKSASEIATVNTPKGLFHVNRMAQGLQMSATEWQSFIDDMTKLIQGCAAFYDDVKISSSSPEEHLRRIEEFLIACRKNNLRLHKDKCVLLTDKLDYLGYSVDKNGLHKTTEKVDAIIKAKRPENADQLKAFTGLCGYYARFVPNLSDIMHPLNLLQRKNARFVWSDECENSFRKIKEEIASERVLHHFDPNKKLILATDASPYALGAVLSHIDGNGNERPIAFASRSLTPTECRYSQIDKESLGIYWGVKKFFNYVYGRKFELQTDCQPLQSIFASTASKPSLSATRLLHYALFLQGFDYEIKYRNSKYHANADFASRFPVTKGNPNQIDMPTQIHRVQLQTLPVTAKEIADEILNDDSVLSLYRQLQGIDPIRRKSQELQEYSLQDGCIFRGERVYIPPSLRSRILKELHVGHLGIVKCRQLARCFVYWPGIDSDIQKEISACTECAVNAKDPDRVKPHPWLPTEEPWQRVHFDCAQFESKQMLIIVDSFSKWVEVYQLNSMSASKLLECLDECFSRLGFPLVCVSDNAPQFVSDEFSSFFKTNGIEHRTSAPYCPISNGQAERFVQIIKSGLKTDKIGSFQERLNRVLLSYRRAPNVVTGKSPAELLFGRKIRSRISLVLPVKKSDTKLPSNVKRKFDIGDLVHFRLYSGSQKWSTGKIQKKAGDVIYYIRFNNQVHKRHVNQIRKASSSIPNCRDETNFEFQVLNENEDQPVVRDFQTEENVGHGSPSVSPNARHVSPNVSLNDSPKISPNLGPRRSKREKRKPIRFSP
ncbi:uncharacterized protein K02A2.6-like [Planococcus citri]